VNASRGPSRARRPPSRHPRPAVGPAVELVIRGGVAWITLARPATRNRCDAELCTALVEACAAAEDGDDVRVAVLAARGRAFSAGLARVHPRPDPAWPDAIAAVGAMTKPVIAAVQGDAVGWGFALALACDVRVAATDAVFALPELREGRFPVGGATQRLPRIVGVARALDLVLLGTRLAARGAADWGLVSEVVPPARLAAAVDDRARALAARGPVALRLGKEAVVRALDLPLADGMRLEEDLYVLLQTTEDRREGVRAFLERRRSRFRGR
jgi:enoyl-CoA hydratase/carnithine racemase